MRATCELETPLVQARMFHGNGIRVEILKQSFCKPCDKSYQQMSQSTLYISMALFVIGLIVIKLDERENIKSSFFFTSTQDHAGLKMLTAKLAKEGG